MDLNWTSEAKTFSIETFELNWVQNMADIIDYEFENEFATTNEPEKSETKASPVKKRKGRGFEKGL